MGSKQCETENEIDAVKTNPQNPLEASSNVKVKILTKVGSVVGKIDGLVRIECVTCWSVRTRWS